MKVVLRVYRVRLTPPQRCFRDATVAAAGPKKSLDRLKETSSSKRAVASAAQEMDAGPQHRQGIHEDRDFA